MPKVRWIVVLAAVMFGSFAFFACGGDDDSGNGDATATQPAGGRDDTDTPEPEGDATQADGGDAPGADEVRAAARKFADATFQADYTLTSPPGESFGSGTMRLYKEGRDKFRFDLTTTQEGQEIEIIFIEAGDTSGFCLKNAGEFGALFGIEDGEGEDGEGVCFDEDPTGGAGLGDFSAELDNLANEDLTVLETSEREIAGEAGKCFKTEDEAGEVTDVCVSDDGVLLFTADASGTTFEATSVSDDVSDSDFDLPYEVRELPALGE